MFIFVSIFIILGEESEKTPLQLMSKGILPMLSSRSFIVSGVTFRSLIHFELIFVYSVRGYSIFVILEDASQFSGEGNGNPLQYSCLENPMDGGAW